MSDEAGENINPRQLVSSARKRVELLERQKNAIDAELAVLNETLRLWEPFENADLITFGTIGGSFRKVEIPEYGLTDAVRVALSLTTPMTPPEIRDALVRGGYDFKDRKNPSANIHEVLRRLVRQEQAKEVPDERGKIRYLRVGTV